MSTKHTEPGPFCQWVIAKDYYDGAMSGIALRSRDDALVYFQAVAWDSEFWERVFALTIVSETLGENLCASLAPLETQRKPFWLPRAESTTAEVSKAWNDLRHAARGSDDWYLVECQDLLDTVTSLTLTPAEATSVAELVRRETVIELEAPPLLDDFFRRVRARPE